MVCLLRWMSFPGQYRKIGNSKNRNSVFFHQRHTLLTSFDVFVVTYRVTNFLPFSTEKTEFPFFVFPCFRVLPPSRIIMLQVNYWLVRRVNLQDSTPFSQARVTQSVVSSRDRFSFQALYRTVAENSPPETPIVTPALVSHHENSCPVKVRPSCLYSASYCPS